MTKSLRTLQFYIYLFLFFGFLNLALLKKPIDLLAGIFFAVLLVIISVTVRILKKYYPMGDHLIFLLAISLCSIGLIMLFRLDRKIAVRQLVWLVLGIFLFLFIVLYLKKGIIKFSEYRYIFLAGTIIFMAMATFFGVEKLGAKNWVKIGLVGFQPSEFGKIFLILYLASALSDICSRKQLIEPCIVIGISLGFMVIQKDLGTALIIFAIAVTMVYLSTSKTRYVLISLGLFSIGGMASYAMFSHIRRRIMIWWNPWLYVYNESYQVVQSMYAIAMGGIFGRGLGMGNPGYVAVNESDFIFSVICEEMGLLIGFSVLILHFLLFYRSIRSAIHANNNFTKLLVSGLSVMIAVQALVIVGGVTGFIPLTGITLPFVSYGGTSLLISFLALGIIQKVSEGDESERK
ncbi:cell division protein FtsW (lipid II flippase) [Ruminiclostridium sufflavum DSM 19573]|uniref:Cell division protein FtsW (Lipid II flippase) n=1 Tax=Ruminiclostridium sufflavum DSM 19573 TaxID=1121337 RepID=A0A318XTZ7_9FIRM|nr:FtsW/RodA/SpoVE family cell cycle protein [Ruminiclostridium sufflavum]PYG90323.1 cell division protein FtsW (lipid II flippase) [Ruminiclostridium sufflavum DSM 19573]